MGCLLAHSGKLEILHIVNLYAAWHTLSTTQHNLNSQHKYERQAPPTPFIDPYIEAHLIQQLGTLWRVGWCHKSSITGFKISYHKPEEQHWTALETSCVNSFMHFLASQTCYTSWMWPASLLCVLDESKTLARDELDAGKDWKAAVTNSGWDKCCWTK